MGNIGIKNVVVVAEVKSPDRKTKSAASTIPDGLFERADTSINSNGALVAFCDSNKITVKTRAEIEDAEKRKSIIKAYVSSPVQAEYAEQDQNARYHVVVEYDQQALENDIEARYGSVDHPGFLKHMTDTQKRWWQFWK